ncbi:MAG TPA: ABC transporter permease [Gammaproteobacteria bacterium]|nr:ABC transporter permease [Gammaproteobacteria bacterium]
MYGFLNDLRIGLRQLVAKPGFATAAILTLALGIGANTAVFSYLSGYLFKPLPYPDAGQLVKVGVRIPKLKDGFFALSLPLYKTVKDKTDAFEDTAFYRNGTFNLNVNGHARHVIGMYTSASLFSVLGVQPLLGAAFTADNMHPGSNQVTLISYQLWRSSFGADPNVVGKRVRLDGETYRVVGVMPKGFAFPDRTAALWVPYAVTPDEMSPKRAFSLNFPFIGRLKPGVSAATANAEAQRAVQMYIHQNVPAKWQKMAQGAGFSISTRSWRTVLLGDRPATLWLLQGAVLLILLITCVNVANLLLSRILGRSHEIAIRTTLGAGRLRLARQLLSEALCLTVPGGLAGILLCWLALRFLGGIALGGGQSIFTVALDWRVGLFAFGAVLFTAALVSVLPIRQLSKTDLQLVLKEGSRTSGSGRRANRMRNALVITELTLATGLLAMAGLVLHSFMNLENVDPGFRKDHVLMASLLVPPTDHPGDKALSSFYTDLIRRVRVLPGVQQAGLGHSVPLDGEWSFNVIFFPGRPLPPSGKPPSASVNDIGPGYFQALGVSLLRGRYFNPTDTDQRTVIVDARFARKYFHDDAVGKQIQLGDGASPKYTIVGVVPTIRYTKLSQSAPTETIYLSDGYTSRSLTLIIHTAVAPNTLIAPLTNLLEKADPNVAVFNVQTMQQHLSNSLSDKQRTMTLLLAFGAIALALAIVGVYAVMSYAVSQRRAECGVRLALGALPEDLQWLVLKDGLKLLAVGLVIGLGLAVLAGFVISARLFGVSPFDPLTLAGSAIVAFLITLVACYLPARRAARLDPAVAIMEQ